MIDTLIKNNKIEIFFQPIISIKNKTIFAFEALTRAYDENENFISPIYLFEQAHKENLANTLDSYVRELALKKFVNYHKKDNELLLFINFESSFIDSSLYTTFFDNVVKYQINPANLVLEIKEDSIKSNDSIINFTNFYREKGFIIAIDDFGTGYSSFDRLALINPDIVKIDRSLITDVNDNFINSEILHAVSNMCHRIGAIVLAEGVEQENEILNCMEKDIDIFQGFYFANPSKHLKKEVSLQIPSLIENIGKKYTQNIGDKIHKKKVFLKDAQELSKKIIHIYNNKNICNTTKLATMITENKKLEAIYIIDSDTGLQKDDTITNIKENTLFHPSKDKHDHNLKEYFFIAKRSSRDDYLSITYVSKASGNMCKTYSTNVTIDNKIYILCLDIKTS